MHRWLLPALILAAGAPVPAAAVSFKIAYDASVTSRSDAAAIEAAFGTVASRLGAALASPVTVRLRVGFGEVNGQSMAANHVGESLSGVMGGYSYAQLRSALTTSARLNPADAIFARALASLGAAPPPGPTSFGVSTAESRALGLIAGDSAITDGAIGFSSALTFDYNPADGIGQGAYDFQAVAFHEISEVLGRYSGLGSKGARVGSVLDLYRYSAPGVHSFSLSDPAYFSIDGGLTDLANFNSRPGGDRGDWATGILDAALAVLPMGTVLPVGAADWAALDALGWNQAASAWFLNQGGATGVPEPATWITLLAGFGLAGAAMRRRGRLGSPATYGNPCP